MVVNGAVRLNGEAKRSSRPTSLKTLPAFTHGIESDLFKALSCWPPAGKRISLPIGGICHFLGGKWHI